MTLDWHDLEGNRVWPVGPEPKVREEWRITPIQISPVPDMIAYLKRGRVSWLKGRKTALHTHANVLNGINTSMAEN